MSVVMLGPHLLGGGIDDIIIGWVRQHELEDPTLQLGICTPPFFPELQHDLREVLFDGRSGPPCTIASITKAHSWSVGCARTAFNAAAHALRLVRPLSRYSFWAIGLTM